MFFEIVNRVRILSKFDENPGNFDEKITETTVAGNVQNATYKFHSSGTRTLFAGKEYRLGRS